MSGRGVAAYGCYLPSGYIERADVAAAHAWAVPGLRGRGKGRRSVASWDQDVITMSVEAARGALRNHSGSVDECWVASTSHPFRDRSSAVVVASALNQSEQAGTLDFAVGRRAATSALLKALQGSDGRSVLLNAAEKRQAKAASWGEIDWGDGAASVLVTDDNPLAICVGSASRNEDFMDFYTADGFDPYIWEERWIKDESVKDILLPTIKQALADAKVAAGDIGWLVFADPVPGTAKVLSKKLGIDAVNVSEQVHASAGDLGVAGPLFGLGVALDQASVGDHVLVVGFGNGCDALVLKVVNKAPRPALAKPLDQCGSRKFSYMQLASARALISVDFGPRSERVEKTALSAYKRGGRNITAFIGGRTAPDQPAEFPAMPVPLNGSLGADGYIPERLVDVPARVVSYTADYLTYSPEPPLHFGLVQFDNGARLLMEYVDVPKEGLAIQAEVEMRFRIKSIDRDRGYRQYFWKATPKLLVDGE